MKVRVPMTVEVCRSPLHTAVHESAKLALALLCLLSGFSVTANAQTALPATLRAADFDQGANGVSYRDTTSGNSGGYYRVTDVDIEACSEGGVSIGWASAGEWLNYTVNVPKAGTYSLELRVASENGGRMNVQFGGSNKTGSMSVPSTGGWQNWTTVSTTVNLSAGVQVMRVSFETDGINLSAIGIGGGSGSASGGSAGGRTLPGTIEAEDFDDGGNGGAYWDSTSGNSGGQYRNTDVDIEGSSEGSYNIGWTAAGEWLHYTVNVQSGGAYTLNLRVASTRGGTIYVLFNGTNKTGTIRVPVTGGYQAWTTVSAPVNLDGGTQVMRVVFESGGVNLNSISVGGSGGSVPPPSSVSAPFGGTAASVPGTIQAEGFDSGGAGVAYGDQTSGNAGGAYRATDVDIEEGASGYAVGWTGAGEWLQYTINVTAAGNYVMAARVASAGNGGTFHVETNGRKWGSLSIPDTGWWSNYQDVTATVYLDAGVQTLRIVFDSNGSSGAAGNIDFVRFSSEATAPAPTPPTPPSGGSGGRLRVMTWNINFGSDPWGQAQQIADSGADVAMLQEASLWDEDMRVTYPQRLQQLTGQKWYSVFASHSGRYSPMEGTMILSRLPLLDQSTRNAYDRGFSRILVSVGGVQVNLFDAHLDWPDTNMRTLQEQDFMWWAAQFGGRRILGGDFNSWWGEYWIHVITADYSDTWVDVTGSQENGYTLNGSVRFDYLFHNAGVNPTDAWVTPTNRSDHAPMIADYTIR